MGHARKLKVIFTLKYNPKFYRLALPKSTAAGGTYTLIWAVISRKFFRIFSHKMLILATRTLRYHVR